MTSKDQKGPTPGDVQAGHLSVLEWTRQRIRVLEASLPPSAERVIDFVENLLRCPGAERLRPLMVAALFKVIATDSERVRMQLVSPATPARDVFHIECDDPDRGTTAYHYQPSAITRARVDGLVRSTLEPGHRPSHIIFVPTDPVAPEVSEYAAGVYQRTGGIEFAILDCIGFARHFLHLFHRHRTAFLDAYQALVLDEPDSGVSFALKQAFLALRQAATPAPEADA